MAALEALASGTPLVAVDEGALSELVVPGAGVTCRLDADSFADGLSRILGGDRHAQRVAARARAEQFQWNHSGHALLGRYETLSDASTLTRSQRRRTTRVPGHP